MEHLTEADQMYGEMAVLGHLGLYQNFELYHSTCSEKVEILEYEMEQSFDMLDN